jgi:glutaredoxin 3
MSIVMYLKQTCPFCVMAKRLLAGKGQEWIEFDIQVDPERRAEMVERTGRFTVPQIFIDDQHIGGFDDLSLLDAEGRLDDLL